MHVQFVTFNLTGMAEADFLKVCDEVFVPGLVSTPGLLSKVWLHEAGSNAYAGLYTWRDKEAMREFMQADFFKAFAGSPNFTDITSREFDLMEQSRWTNGVPSSAVVR
jgi:hypothetical protein